MMTTRIRWAVAAGIVVAAIVTPIVVSFYSRRPAATSMPKIPASDQVVEISAKMNGTLYGLPVTDRFKIPKEFHAEVCRQFSGQTRKWNFSAAEEGVMYKFKLGDLHFYLLSGEHLNLAFYTVGKGAIGYSLGRDYYLAHTEMEDGGSYLLAVLDAARQAVDARSD